MPRTANSANELRCTFPSLSANEALARSMAAAFCAQMNPTCDELSDIKCAVSEAVTNALLPGYGKRLGTVRLHATITDTNLLPVNITDNGRGIPNLKQAMQPFWTSVEGFERSGMGFTVMESFMDSVDVASKVNSGTTVRMIKQFSGGAQAAKEA